MYINSRVRGPLGERPPPVAVAVLVVHNLNESLRVGWLMGGVLRGQKMHKGHIPSVVVRVVYNLRITTASQKCVVVTKRARI